MKTNAAGIALIKGFEKLALTAYRCPAGVLTIGYGSTGPHVREGMVITEQRAEELFRDDLARFEREVSKRIGGTGNRNQFSAMVSLCFNIGPKNFAGSSVLRLHKEGDHAKAAECFLLWNKATGADGKKRELKGLTRRRAAEAALYLTPTEADEVADPQRTRAADVEPAPVAQPVISPGQIATGGALSGASLAGIQAVSQVSTLWSWLVENGIEPKIVLAVLGVALVMALVGLGWKLIESRRVRG